MQHFLTKLQLPGGRRHNGQLHCLSALPYLEAKNYVNFNITSFLFYIEVIYFLYKSDRDEEDYL